MVSYFNEDAQLFYAVTSKGGRVYLGYGPSRAEAEAYCFELVQERKKEINHGGSKKFVH